MTSWTRRSIGPLLALSLAASSCDLSSGPSGTISVYARAQNGACPTVLEGTGVPGDPCSTSADCKEICCSCSAKQGQSFAGSACIDGACASATTTCAKAEQTSSTVCQ